MSSLRCIYKENDIRDQRAFARNYNGQYVHSSILCAFSVFSSFLYGRDISSEREIGKGSLKPASDIWTRTSVSEICCSRRPSCRYCPRRCKCSDSTSVHRPVCSCRGVTNTSGHRTFRSLGDAIHSRFRLPSCLVTVQPITHLSTFL